MKHTFTIGLALSAMALSLNVGAASIGTYTSGGTDVNAGDYKDYLVHIATESGRCGAQVIASNWLLTAKHCVNLIDGGANDGETQEIVVYQGLELLKRENIVYAGTATLYGNNNTVDKQQLSAERYINQHISPKLASLYWEWSSVRGFSYDNSKSYIHTPANMPSNPYNDLALIKLDEPVAHNSTAIVTPGFKYHLVDAIESEHTLQSLSLIRPNQQFTFRGWGQSGLNNPAPHPETLQHISVTVTAASPLNIICEVATYDAQGRSALPCFTNKESAIQAKQSAFVSLYKPSYNPFFFTETALQAAQEGDSGTGLFNDQDELVAIASRVGGVYPNSYNVFESLTHHWDFILQTINDLNAPKIIRNAKHSAGTYNAFHEVRIQNLSMQEKLIAPYMQHGGYYRIESSTCPNVLRVGQDCTITLRANSKAFAMGASEVDVLWYNNTDHTAVSLSVERNVTPPAIDCTELPDVCKWDESDSDSTPAKKSSGGNTSIIVLMLLLGLLRTRQH